MKYWNKSKKYRNQQWHQVTTVRAHGQNLPLVAGKSYDFGALKYWCQQQASEGKFYYSPYTGWWFEKMEDASWFVLKWAS